jgi:hypothetical protein
MTNINKDFDFSEFAIGVIQTIDSIRSSGKNSRSFKESRINALYRAIGLPAANNSGSNEVDQSNSSGKGNNTGETSVSTNVDDFNNGNIVKSKVGTTFPTPAQIAGFNKRRNAGNTPVSTLEIDEFLDVSNETIISAISETNTRKRGSLRPMMVDNGIEIWPLSKRVAQAFSSEKDRKKNDVVFKSPFIESIISIRLKTDNIQNTANQQKVELTLPSNMQALGNDIQSVLVDSGNNIGHIIDDAIERVEKVRKYMSANVIPNTSGSPNEKPKVASKDNLGKLEEQIREQEAALAVKEARASIAQFEDTNNVTSNARTLKDNLLLSDFLTMVIPTGISELRQSLNENKSIIKRYENDLKKAHRDLDLVFGTFAGVSGTDILAISIALFDIDLNKLVSLLNDKGRKNLAKFLGVENISTVFHQLVDVDEAVTELETKVESVLTEIQSIITNKFRDKPNNKKKRKKSNSNNSGGTT